MKLPKVQVIYNTSPEEPNQIDSFYHCGKCLDEKPDGVSPREFGNYEMGITKTGDIQIWCKRHECNVALLEIKLK